MIDGWSLVFSLAKNGMFLGDNQDNFVPFRQVDGLFFLPLYVPGTNVTTDSLTVDCNDYGTAGASKCLHLQMATSGMTNAEINAVKLRNQSLLSLWY